MLHFDRRATKPIALSMNKKRCFVFSMLMMVESTVEQLRLTSGRDEEFAKNARILCRLRWMAWLAVLYEIPGNEGVR